MGLFYSTKKESVTIVIHMNYIPIISQVFWIQIKTLCEKYPEKLLKKKFHKKKNIHKNRKCARILCGILGKIKYNFRLMAKGKMYNFQVNGFFLFLHVIF